MNNLTEGTLLQLLFERMFRMEMYKHRQIITNNPTLAYRIQKDHAKIIKEDLETDAAIRHWIKTGRFPEEK